MLIKTTLSAALQQQGVISAATAVQLQQHNSPWWLQVLLGLAAWIAALLIISSFMGPLLALADNNLWRSIAALALLASAIWLALQSHEFLQQMSVAIALAGQGLLVYVVYDQLSDNDIAARYACAIFSTLLLLSPLKQLHQRLSLGIAMFCLLSLVRSAPLLGVVSSVLAAAAVLGWSSRSVWASSPLAARLKSMLEVTTLTALGLALLGQCVLQLELQHWLGDKLALARALYSALAAILLLTTVFWLSRLATLPSRLLLLTVTALLCVALYPASAVLVSLALLLACFYGCHQRWSALCMLSMLLAIGQFYYDLQLNLLHKSALLALSGGVLLLGWLLLQRYQRRLT
jgi:hypothetical protein